MKNYNIELPKYIGKLLRDILFNNDIDFEISEVADLYHFQISINNDNQQQKVGEFIKQYVLILTDAKISDKDLQYILEVYDFNDIYKLISNNDYSIYNISNMDNFGHQIFDIYECIELSDSLTTYFDFAGYGENYLDNVEYVELENGRVIIFYS